MLRHKFRGFLPACELFAFSESELPFPLPESKSRECARFKSASNFFNARCSSKGVWMWLCDVTSNEANWDW